MFVRVDRVKCLSNGQCAAVAPGTFQLSSAGELGYTPAPNDRDTNMQLERAARLCPTAAITLERETQYPDTGPDSESIDASMERAEGML